MVHLARWVILGAALAVCGCTAGVVEPEQAANALRLLGGSAVSSPVQADDAASPASTSPDGKICVTVEGPPLDGDPSQPADVSPAAYEPDDEATEPADLAAPVDELLRDEPEAGAVVSDEPAEVAEEPVETIVQPLVVEPAESYFTDEQEEVTTPRPLPVSPFKSGADESGIDRFTRQVTDVPVDIRPTEGVMPADLAAARFADEPTIDETWPSDEPADVFCSYTPWTICYRPLYFEDIKLERYGCNVGCLQPGLSGVRFFSSIAAMPYKMTVRPPRSCQCSNGFSRCGDCPLPGYGKREFRLDASLVEAAAVAGVVYILP